MRGHNARLMNMTPRLPPPDHGESKPGTAEYRSWASMWRRCEDPKAIGWKRYGGRGIRVCEEWRDYRVFLAALGRKPTPSHSIDRWPDNDGDYKPGNVRWATASEQARNRQKRAQMTYAKKAKR